MMTCRILAARLASRAGDHVAELPASNLEDEDPQLVVSIAAREAHILRAERQRPPASPRRRLRWTACFEVQHPISPRTPEPSFNDSTTSSCCCCYAEQACAKAPHCSGSCAVHQQPHHEQCILSRQNLCCLQSQKQQVALFASREASYLSSIAKLQCQVTRMAQLQHLLAADYADLESVLKESERQRRNYAARYAFVVLDTDSDGYISTAQVGP